MCSRLDASCETNHQLGAYSTKTQEFKDEKSEENNEYLKIIIVFSRRDNKEERLP